MWGEQLLLQDKEVDNMQESQPRFKDEAGFLFWPPCSLLFLYELQYKV